MSAMPPKEANPSGLHQRYNVTKVSGKPVDPMATYFVLRLDSHGDDYDHIRACRAAADAYADVAGDVPHLEQIAADLRTLVTNLSNYGC